MPRNASGRPRCLHDQCKRRVGQDNDDLKGAFITGGFITSTTSDDTTRRASSPSDVLLPRQVVSALVVDAVNPPVGKAPLGSSVAWPPRRVHWPRSERGRPP